MRAKLLNTKRISETFRSDAPDASTIADSDDDYIASLPDDIDAMEDILFDRAPANANQVKLFGAWLDDAVAGRKTRKRISFTEKAVKGSENADTSVDSHKLDDLSEEEAVEKGKAYFDHAMLLFNKGQYRIAISSYKLAVDMVGVGSRLGGQYQLWHAQALDACGEKGAAVQVLQELLSHADSDVRKVSSELLFIVTAPALEFDAGTFLEIPTFDDERPVRPVGVLTSAYGPLKTALLKKKPDRHTLEWYLEQERPPKVKENSAMETMLIAGAVVCSMALIFHPH